MAASQTTAVTSSSTLGLLVYDGDCGFCTSAARWFADLAGESAAVAPWQALELAEHDLTEAECTTAAYWLRDGQKYRGADAFAAALQVCNTPWRLVGRVLGVPPVIWLARAGYPLLAKYRHKLPGATNACRIPPA